MINLERLNQILSETTISIRKGAVQKTTQHEDYTVVEVFAMSAEDELNQEHLKDFILVDCHFFKIGVEKDKAENYAEELHTILSKYPQSERLAAGPSYIEVGGILGSQELALRLFALGEVLGFWKVITPAGLGLKGEYANHLAGMGMVMITGYKGKAHVVNSR